MRRPCCVAVVVLGLGAAGPALADTAQGEPALRWAKETASPRRPAAGAPAPDPLHAGCGSPDPALEQLARATAIRQGEGGSLFPPDELAYRLRAAGDPHVWARAWSVSGGALEETDLERRVRAWSGGWTSLGVRRCGVARALAADGTNVVAAVAIDALADIEPLPTVARVGQWIKLEGRMLVPAESAKVVLLGPRGAPRTVVASLSGGRVRSTFSVDQPGPWLVQVLATVSTGPRPVLEAMVFAGATPPSQFVRQAAPGETASVGARDDADAVVRMLNAARASERLPPLVRDAALDALARVHSEEMARVKMVGHDVGFGDPRERFTEAGIRARIAGENVASAATLESAHRALWASPSHRGNLLHESFVRVGAAVVRGAGGTVWVTQLFAG